MKSHAVVLTLALLAAPWPAFAQGAPTPTSPPHPSMPWSGVPYSGRASYGSVVRYIEVPPQQMVINVYLPGPGSFSGEYEQQVIEIPGYVVAETTTGYIHPPRWSVQQVTPGVYQWVALPEQFEPK